MKAAGIHNVAARRRPGRPAPAIFDGHLDLAMNAVLYNRDLTWSVARLREYEKAVAAEDERGRAGVTLPEMARGGVRWAAATIFARAKPGATAGDCFRRSDCDSATPSLAHALGMAQVGYYQWLASRRWVTLAVKAEQLTTEATAAAVGQVVKTGSRRARPASPPLTLVLLMESADCLAQPEDLAHWRDLGVRALGLTHITPNGYACGNGADGPLTAPGLRLLRCMRRLGVALDVSHLADLSLDQALDAFDGPVLASHSNCRALAPGRRQLTDAQIRRVAQRDGVVGMVLHSKMLDGRWKPGQGRRTVPLTRVAEHIDHICQLTGSHRHAGLGSDLDGGFGTEKCPAGIDTIADLPKLAPLLARRGYGRAQIDDLLHGNWLRFWRGVLSA